MNDFPCANSTCMNKVAKAGAYCDDCAGRERAATPWISAVVTNAEKEAHRRKIEQDNKHRKGGEE